MNMSAQNEIDWLILKNIPNGFFIEAGGSDPREQNNTNLLEQNGWNGLIIEPKKEFNDIYSSIRPKSIVENVVLVSKDYDGDTILGDFSHYMMGGVENIHGLDWNPTEHKCSTLTNILKKYNIEEVHFLSLDVEGYEIDVLNGIDFENIFFHVLVIENHGKWDNDANGELDRDRYKNGDLSALDTLKYDNFDFLNDFGFYKKHKISQHEIYINKKSKYYESFVI